MKERIQNCDLGYSVRLINAPTKPGCWDYINVEVFHGRKKVGKYQYKYSSWDRLFCPFVAQDGSTLALYSSDYTATRLMRLPDCVDIGGEKPNGGGFCPVELYVPKVHIRPTRTYDGTDPEPRMPNHDPKTWAITKQTPEGHTRYYWPNAKESEGMFTPERVAEFKAACEDAHARWDAWSKRNEFYETYAPFGLVAGCHWGDDTSWKIQHLDLTRAHEGVLVRSDPFDYCELPRGVKLAAAVDVGSWEPNRQVITLASQKRFKL